MTSPHRKQSAPVPAAPPLPAGVVAVSRSVPADPRKPPPDEEVISYLRHLLRHPEHALLTVAVTPGIAHFLKGTSRTPGMVLRERVRTLSQEITQGRWVHNGQPVILAGGHMIDGLQRVQAIIEANLPAVLDLRFGIRQEASSSIDNGVARTVTRLFGLERIPYATQTSSVLRMLHLNSRVGEDQWWRRIYSPTQALADYRRCDTVAMEQACRMSFHATRKIPGLARSPVTTALYLAIRETDPLEVEQFFNAALHETRAPKGSPTRRLREWGRDLPRSGDTVERVQRFGVAMAAWRAWREDENLPKPLKWRQHTPAPLLATP